MFEQLQLAMPLTGLLLVSSVMALADGVPLVDPTRPYDQPLITDTSGGEVNEPEVPLPVLQAVFAQGQSRSALLDGQRVSVGSQLGPYRVVSIEGQQVVVEHNEEQSVLTTRLLNVKRRASEDAK